MPRIPFLSYLPILLLSVLVSSAIVGCGAPKPIQDEHKVFFPEPPAPPRLQFLHSYTGSKDITDAASSFDTFLAGREEAGRELIKPFGVTIDNNKIYVCDTQASVMVFDLTNRSYHQLEGARGLGKVVQPLNISKDIEGHKFVADPIRGEVLMFDKDDNYMKSFGLSGQWKPLDAVAHEGLLYAVDGKNHNIAVFDIETAKKIRTMGSSAKDVENKEQLGTPTNIAVGPDGLLYITDAGRFKVVIYDRDGHQRGTIGRAGVNLGHFARPRGIAIDSQGLVYVADAAFENVQVFRSDGQLLFFFGGSGSTPGTLTLPAAIAIDYDNVEYFQQYADPNFEIEYLVLVVSQFGDQLVNVYGFGRERGRTYPTDEEVVEQAEETFKEWQIKEGVVPEEEEEEEEETENEEMTPKEEE
ncbi:MAG: hypothetical protein K9K37_07155 [Desulfocapsa sp.]|nr:hypothetical protein [Desulfocapsa sp.]